MGCGVDVVDLDTSRARKVVKRIRAWLVTVGACIKGKFDVVEHGNCVAVDDCEGLGVWNRLVVRKSGDQFVVEREIF